MTSHAAVGVDDDLATREAGVAHRTTDHEPTGRVDEDVVVVVGKLFGNHRADHVLDQIGPDHRVAVDAVVVLRGDEHGLEPDGSVALVLEGDLGLGVGSQVRMVPALRTSACFSAMRCARWIGSGMSTSVSSLA